MQTSIRKVGNSAGMTLPASLLKSQGLSIGDKLDIALQDGCLIIRKQKPHYNLQQLIQQCDTSAPMPDDLLDWQETEVQGQEIW